MRQTMNQLDVLQRMQRPSPADGWGAFMAQMELDAALRYLGVRWVFHKDNPNRPRRFVKGGF